MRTIFKIIVVCCALSAASGVSELREKTTALQKEIDILKIEMHQKQEN
jgi:uncharacterized small protein (DUF1192 family)